MSTLNFNISHDLEIIRSNTLNLFVQTLTSHIYLYFLEHIRIEWFTQESSFQTTSILVIGNKCIKLLLKFNKN